ncbi:MAG: hypothetical protein K2X93_28125 [Candidatus Obscuribacterales bacterium]|nr:hypothetical protein [Candidatus Obscuribacterales bacterium]
MIGLFRENQATRPTTPTRESERDLFVSALFPPQPETGDKPKPGSDKATSEKPAEKKADAPNQWTVKGTKDGGITSFGMTAEYKVSADEFKKANPKIDPKTVEVDKDKTFTVRHPTTGELDEGWKVKSKEKDGSLTLTRDYTMDLKTREGKAQAGLVQGMKHVPDSFLKKLDEKVKELPPNLISSLERNGYKIIAATNIPEAIPALADLTPRGWPKDLSFFESDGTHDSVSKRIIAPMRMGREGSAEPVTRDNVVLHQVGHALDHAHGFLSSKPEFVEAYNKDMAAIFDKRHPIYKYFSQKEENAGRQEVFASMFGVALGKPENETDMDYLQRHFPNSLEVVKKQMKEIK